MERLSEGAIRVLIVDDHLVREGLRAFLESADDIVVCGEAAGATEALRMAGQTRPDVVIMDVRLPDGSGVFATREILARCPGTRVVILTSFSDEDALFASIVAGADGYVLKTVGPSELVRAIRSVAAGHSFLDPGVTSMVLDRLRHVTRSFKDEKLARLSPSEERILSLMTQGKTQPTAAGRTVPESPRRSCPSCDGRSPDW